MEQEGGIDPARLVQRGEALRVRAGLEHCARCRDEHSALLWSGIILEEGHRQLLRSVDSREQVVGEFGRGAAAGVLLFIVVVGKVVVLVEVIPSGRWRHRPLDDAHAAGALGARRGDGLDDDVVTELVTEVVEVREPHLGRQREVRELHIRRASAVPDAELGVAVEPIAAQVEPSPGPPEARRRRRRPPSPSRRSARPGLRRQPLVQEPDAPRVLEEAQAATRP